MNKNNSVIIIMPILLVFCLVLNAYSADKFDLMNLIGEWEGQGFFEVPVSGVTVEIEGSGLFTHDSTNNRIRTSMKGEKFFINYADSGYLQHYPETDSVSWEVWDNWGKHSMYWGIIDDDMLVADRIYKKNNYQVVVKFPHPDTLDFHLVVHKKDGTNYDKASFLLWRVKEDK